jgi:uncharacterized protein YycO
LVQGPVGRLIQLGEYLCGDGFTSFEHAFVVLNGGELIEAQPGGAVIRSLSEYDGRHVVYVTPGGLTNEQREAVCAAALRYVGVPYSFVDYLAIAAHRLHLPVPFLRRYVASTGHQICSQLVDRSYMDAKVPLFSDARWPGFVTPADLSLSMGGDSRA